MSEIEDLSFEQAFDELDEAVAKLEGDELSLEESLAVFERATTLAKACQRQLDQAELRISRLLDEEAGDDPVEP